VKRKKQDMSIRELFRHKLENAEVIPRASVNSKLMRSLARREFIRFNPARFNIYYLGGILLASITAGIILFSGSVNSDDQTPVNLSVNPDKINNNSYINVPAGQVIKTGTAKSHNRPTDYQQNKLKSESKQESAVDAVQNSEPRNKYTIIPAGINDSFSKIGLFPGAPVSNKKLQTRTINDDVLFETSALVGCVPLKLHFTNKVSSCDSCIWMFGDGGYSTQMNPDWIFDVEGVYHVVLKVFGPNGQQATSSISIIAYPKPQARFEISPEKVVLPDDEIRFLNYSANGIQYKWDFGDGNTSDLFEPRHKYLKFSNYNVQLVAISENGCSDSLVVMNAFSGSEYFIEFPNAFIPNPEGPSGGYYSSKSDEMAQVFHPSFSGVSDYQLKIFSKLGILIFESNDLNIGWDGYFKGQLSNPGVYVWKVRGTFSNGEPFIKMGDITLLKN
jgi:PKD repeat protein